MDLAERGGGGRSEIEFGEARPPVGAEFGLHAAATKAAPIGGAWDCSAHQLAGVIGGQRLGDGRHHLGDFHHRALERAERLGQGARIAAAPPADQPAGADARRQSAGVDAEVGVAPGAGGKTIGFVVARHLRRSRVAGSTAAT